MAVNAFECFFELLPNRLSMIEGRGTGGWPADFFANCSKWPEICSLEELLTKITIGERGECGQTVLLGVLWGVIHCRGKSRI